MARLYYLLNVAQHRVATRANKACDEALGVSAAQLGALFVIEGTPMIRQSDLATALSCTKPAVTALTFRLDQGGFLRRLPCADDGRVNKLKLTAKGKRAVDKGRTMVADLQGKMTEGFSDAEIAIIARFLGATMERFV